VRAWRWVTLVVVVVLQVIPLGATQSQAHEQSEEWPIMCAVVDQTDVLRATATYQVLMGTFYVPDLNLYREHSELLPEDRAFSNLWPYSGVISAVNALAKMPEGTSYHSDLARVLEGLEQYWDGGANPPAYDSYVREFGGGQKYYDDNEWLGLDLIEAYRTLGDPMYLEKAKATFEFAVSGWSYDLGGGIYWREQDTSTRNTCSNGPAAVLALKLYQETGDQEYQDWAIRILEWLKPLKAPSGVYWDSVSDRDVIDFRTYTYNTGTVIHANALLYQITGREAYLKEARALAETSLRHFARTAPEAEIALYPATPWFNAVLLKAYIALYYADPQHDPRYIEAFRSNLDHAWEYARSEEGLFTPNWAGNAQAARGSDGKHGVYWLLDQAAMVELYALLAQISVTS